MHTNHLIKYPEKIQLPGSWQIADQKETSFSKADSPAKRNVFLQIYELESFILIKSVFPQFSYEYRVIYE